MKDIDATALIGLASRAPATPSRKALITSANDNSTPRKPAFRRDSTSASAPVMGELFGPVAAVKFPC